MSSELTILGYFGILVLLQFLLQTMALMSSPGMASMVSARDGHASMAFIGGRFSSNTPIAAQTYFWSCLAHVVTYPVGAPWMRSLIWSLAWAASLWLYVLIL